MTKETKKTKDPKEKKMRIFAAGDIHGDSNLAKKLADMAKKEKADLVILCGDITNYDVVSDNLIGPFLKNKTKVLFVPGNHDSFPTADFFSELYKIKNIHGYSVRYNDIGIFGAGGANIGVAQLSEDELFDTLKKGHEHISYLKKKVMVTHVHPSGTKMEKFTSFFPGSTGIRKAVDMFQPDIIFCSHVHEAEGIEEKIGKTRVINVGRKGKVIDI
ncbi:metallophosphoesterase [Candidatus Woesearchaeota archaeon]|nr:metallophosphoesterase [Candidatus Woesearchaeota archaeon]